MLLSQLGTCTETAAHPPTTPPAQEKGNILPGTVVDNSICHPSGFDFFLNSHAGLKVGLGPGQCLALQASAVISVRCMVQPAVRAARLPPPLPRGASAAPNLTP